MGHSSGEIAASCAAGLIGFNESIVVAYLCGKVVKDIDTAGAMMAVDLGSDAVQPYFAGHSGQVVVACDNSPSLITLGGDANALEVVKQKLDADSVFARIVKIGGKAYHPHHMKPASAHYRSLIRQARQHVTKGVFKHTAAVMVSSVTNTVLDNSIPVGEHYWCANLVSPVKFNQIV